MDNRTISNNTFGNGTRISQNNVSLNVYHDGEPRQKKIDACRNALFLANPIADRENLKSSKGERTAGTCEWIRDNEIYQSWLRGDSPCLWISGGAGKGKTILSIFLTEELEGHAPKDEKTILLFYFCSQDEKHNSATAVLRGLLYQLIAKRPDLADKIWSEFDSPEKTQETLKSPNALWGILERLLRDPGLGMVYCVLDGLDECDDTSTGLLATKFGKYFSKDVKSNGGRLQLVIVSRKISGLDVFPQVKLDPDNNERVDGDIQKFIASSVQRLERVEGFDKIRRQVETTLLNRAQGTFLWVGLVMEELLKKKTCVEIWETLNGIPPGLDTIYHRMLKQIESSRRPVLIEILQWAALAVRPLTLHELKAAVHIPPTDGLESSGDQAIRDYITLCGHILTTHDEHVSLVHQSVRDYLMQEKYDNDSKPNEFYIKSDEAHARLARICLDCIEASELRDTFMIARDTSVLEDAPLLRYAAMHWPEHARRSLYADKDVNFSRPFFQKKSMVRMHWWSLYTETNSIYLPLHNPSLLETASYLGIDSIVCKLLVKKNWPSKVRKYINRRGMRGSWALRLAAFGGRTSTVQLLLANGADIDEMNRHGNAATSKGEGAIVRLLLANSDANVHIEDEPGGTALISAARYGGEAIIQLLLANGVDVNAVNERGESALMVAAKCGRRGIVQLLLANGADVNARNKDGRTALSLAAGDRQKDVIQPLLANGADVDIEDHDGDTALITATRKRQTAIVQMLLANGANVNARDKNGLTALIIATGKDNEVLIQMLLANGADINARDNDGEAALSIACRRRLEDAVQLLLANGAEVNARDNGGRTALSIAAAYKHKGIIQLLLAHGADVNARDNDGNTPLMRAWKHEAIVQLLLANGADVNARNNDGEAALIIACSYGFEDTVQMLLANGANVNARDKNGLTALIIATGKDNEVLIQMLLANGADVNARNNDGKAALIIACSYGFEDTIQLLLANGADVNSRDNYGYTALSLATLFRRKKIKQLLLANGAEDHEGGSR